MYGQSVSIFMNSMVYFVNFLIHIIKIFVSDNLYKYLLYE